MFQQNALVVCLCSDWLHIDQEFFSSSISRVKEKHKVSVVYVLDSRKGEKERERERERERKDCSAMAYEDMTRVR